LTANRLQLNIRPDVTYFGSVNTRGNVKNFGILQEDRRRHMYVLGKTGMGKSTLLQNMVLQDIYNGHGVCFLDPHGDTAESILHKIPEHRQQDVIYFNPADTTHPMGLNMLEPTNDEEVFLLASGMMAVFQRIWEGMWSSRMEYILNNTLLALLEVSGNTLLGVLRMLTDDDFRDYIVKNLRDPLVKNFWLKEYASFNDKYRTEAVAPIMNKIGQFFSTPLIRNILGQTHSTLNMRKIMDERKIMIVNLSKGRLGEDNSNLLGSLLVTKIQLAAMSRVDIPEEQRADFSLYVDEFQNFTTDSFASILSEARKYRLSLVLAHQYISQLTESGNEKIKNAIFGNVGSILSFRVGSEDALRLERELEPVFTAQTLTSLSKTQIALKMSIDGKVTEPFQASTLPLLFEDISNAFEYVTQYSQQTYSLPVEMVSDGIQSWLDYDFTAEIGKQKSKRQQKKKSQFSHITGASKKSGVQVQSQPVQQFTPPPSSTPAPQTQALPAPQATVAGDFVRPRTTTLPTKQTARSVGVSHADALAKLQSRLKNKQSVPRPQQPSAGAFASGTDWFSLPE